MKKEIDSKLNSKNIKPTAMRQLVLQVLIEQKNAINLPELERIFEKLIEPLYTGLLKLLKKTNSFIVSMTGAER